MIILDAGHGGHDPGICANGVMEKNWTLEVSLYQYKRLKELGVAATLTRDRDVTLEPNKRASMVKTSGAGICISNHFNGGGGSGSEMIHSIFSKGELAKVIAKEVKAAGMPVRRVFSRSGDGGKDYYYMHRQTGKVETIIVEYGFLDNEHDFKILRDQNNRFKYAEAVVMAICKKLGHPYYKNKMHNPTDELFYVQSGAFKEKKNAESLAKRLQADGYSAIIKN